MRIQFKDFVPEVTRTGLFTSPTASSLKEVTEEANSWIEKTNPKIINIETVVIPNPDTKDYQSQSITPMINGGALFLQIIRVWYEE